MMCYATRISLASHTVISGYEQKAAPLFGGETLTSVSRASDKLILHLVRVRCRPVRCKLANCHVFCAPAALTDYQISCYLNSRLLFHNFIQNRKLGVCGNASIVWFRIFLSIENICRCSQEYTCLIHAV